MYIVVHIPTAVYITLKIACAFEKGMTILDFNLLSIGVLYFKWAGLTIYAIHTRDVSI